ncbi:hypothetical protein [Agarivorans sp. 1_MG-2023]|uniref:hypothetical protein n=1 Tax=Agarivorans sp. 1_MG-2023 TaxID=3062634 RepID=UPI0026E3722D|nr:hypothetical protein [Agarivorans sp. 1_MG-2023]MDO6765194.1 hypothetical protein [Agarivorans sp. 1_MG-2023]
MDTYNHRQYLLVPELSKDQVEELKQKLTIAFEPILEKHGLYRSTPNSKVEGVILYYSDGSNFGIGVGGRNTSQGVVIDITHFHPGRGETPRYSEIVEELVKTLRDLENFSYIELDYRSQIEI